MQGQVQSLPRDRWISRSGARFTCAATWWLPYVGSSLKLTFDLPAGSCHSNGVNQGVPKWYFLTVFVHDIGLEKKKNNNIDMCIGFESGMAFLSIRDRSHMALHIYMRVHVTVRMHVTPMSGVFKFGSSF